MAARWLLAPYIMIEAIRDLAGHHPATASALGIALTASSAAARQADRGAVDQTWTLSSRVAARCHRSRLGVAVSGTSAERPLAHRARSATGRCVFHRIEPPRHRPRCSAHRSAAGPPPCARPTRRPAAPTIDPAATHPGVRRYREDGKKQAVCLSARCLTAGAVGTWRAGSSHARDHGERASRAN
jgi:hypothetical protein